MNFRLAHLSDLHLGPLPLPPLGSLLSKRVFGYANWVRNRASDRSTAIVDALVGDLWEQAADHVVVTGDLVNIALEHEFVRAAQFLARLGDAADVTVTLGNHDAYVPGAAARASEHFADYMGSDDGSTHLPTVRRRGDVALIGVSTGIATLPGVAAGRVGQRQLDALAAALDRYDAQYRVVLIHHPPDAELAKGRRGLRDLDAVRDTLAQGCADLVLHGHNHTPTLIPLETSCGIAPVVGVPSASSDGHRYPLASYAIYDIDTEVDVVSMTRRGFETPDGEVKTLQRVALRR